MRHLSYWQFNRSCKHMILGHSHISGCPLDGQRVSFGNIRCPFSFLIWVSSSHGSAVLPKPVVAHQLEYNTNGASQLVMRFSSPQIQQRSPHYEHPSQCVRWNKKKLLETWTIQNARGLPDVRKYKVCIHPKKSLRIRSHGSNPVSLGAGNKCQEPVGVAYTLRKPEMPTRPKYFHIG